MFVAVLDASQKNWMPDPFGMHTPSKKIDTYFLAGIGKQVGKATMKLISNPFTIVSLQRHGKWTLGLGLQQRLEGVI